MARIGVTDTCIDLYEASDSGGNAASLGGVHPWIRLGTGAAGRGCANAGKRLCTAAEWQAACTGPSGTEYPYGSAFVAGLCNDMNGTACLKDGSGVLPTGSRPGCEGGVPGILDMSGNVWEWVSDTSGGRCGLIGGSVDSCADPDVLACKNLEWQDCSLAWPALGFRCCLDLS
jgi:formylglycine-generating enzyme required for sulfatase activity